MRPLLPALLLGCAPPDDHDWYTDQWSAAWEVCQPPEDYSWSILSSMTWQPSATCKAWVLEDVNWDLPTSLRNAGGDPDHLAQLQEEQEALTWALLDLLAGPMGTLEDLPRLPRPWGPLPIYTEQWEQVMGELAEEVGEEDLRPLTYNLVTSKIGRTMYAGEPLLGGDAVATVDSTSGEVLIREISRNPAMATVSMIHEAAHFLSSQDHIACPYDSEKLEFNPNSRAKLCDLDWWGAWGFQAGWNVQRCGQLLLLPGLDREEVRKRCQVSIDDPWIRITPSTF